MRSLVQNAPYGIGTISVREDRFLHANPALVKLLGYKSEAEVLALAVSRDLYSGADSYGSRAQPIWSDFFSAVELNWKRKDGRPVIVRASGRRIPATVDQGDLIEIIAEDVTARRSLEEQLRQAQKLEALGQLSGSVAHDFNNLLSVIIGYSELLSANPASEGPMRTHLETIKRAGERAASLTAQLLAFSRRQVLQPSIVNLNSLVRETQKMLQRLMRENVEHKVVLDPELWKTRADPGQIVQVIMNLAINARDAMPKGGTLTIETANVTFGDVTTVHDVEVAPGHYVKMSVSDTGIGMDPETLARIFEPFFTTKEAGRGTGLGLATVYGIVKQTGGYIFADSTVSKGTTFSVYLPQAGHPADGQPSQSRPASIRKGSETLLVVEDEIAFRDLLHEGLQARGYHVLVAANGAEALRVAEEFSGPIRILVTDVIMPQMSGPELARTLRKIRPGTEVLYMSGYTADKVSDISSSGDMILMQKPFYVDDLVQKIQEILARLGAQESRSTPSVS
jgi:PAS domain S-box-containing protein